MPGILQARILEWTDIPLIKPVSPASAGRFLTIGPPGKPLSSGFSMCLTCNVLREDLIGPPRKQSVWSFAEESYACLSQAAAKFWRRQWHPTPVRLPGKSLDGGAW